MYLHKDDNLLFRKVIITVAEKLNLALDKVEKDYYVTMILHEFAKTSEKVVFKGGTSLSKAFQVIDRFSEDVDITFTEHIGSARRKKLKYQIIQPISIRLDMPISNWDRIESDKNYNHYDFVYQPVMETRGLLLPWVKVETALMSYSFPTETVTISNFIYDALKEDEFDILEEFGLLPFQMQVQSLSRTLVDKMFAVCDYYLLNKPRRNSRHLYDIFKIAPYVEIDDSFLELIQIVRNHRMKMEENRAPSARDNINIVELSQKIYDERFYEEDYLKSTKGLISDNLEYDAAIIFYNELIKKCFN